MHYSPGEKNTHHTHSQVNVTTWIVSYFRLLQLLMSTWYSCSYFRVLHVDLLPELAIAIHDIKSEGNVRSSHLAASLLLLKGQFTQKKNTFSYNGSKSYTCIVWKNRSCSLNRFGITWRRENYYLIKNFLWSISLIIERDREGEIQVVKQSVGMTCLTKIHSLIFS